MNEVAATGKPLVDIGRVGNGGDFKAGRDMVKTIKFLAKANLFLRIEEGGIEQADRV